MKTLYTRLLNTLDEYMNLKNCLSNFYLIIDDKHGDHITV